MKMYPTKDDLRLNPSLAALARDYDPDEDGWKAEAREELRATQLAVADYCNPAITLGDPCDCIQAYGPREQLLANPSCPACSGTGRPTRETLVAGIDMLSSLIDE